MGFLHSLKKKTQGSAYLWQVFQEDQRFARITMGMLKWSLEDSGIKFDERAVSDAAIESIKNPKMSIGEFVELYSQRRKQLGG